MPSLQDRIRSQRAIRILRNPWILGITVLTGLLHLVVASRYDIFRNELYFIVCGRHPAFGYVDQPPLVPLIAAATQIFGVHARLLRLPAVVAATALVPVTAAFAELLAHIHAMRPAERIPGKSFRYMLLSATQSGQTKIRFEHDPKEDAKQSDAFRAVWAASKRLTLHPVANGPAVKAQIWKIATEKPAPRTIVFIEKPKEAVEFYRRLGSEDFVAALVMVGVSLTLATVTAKAWAAVRLPSLTRTLTL